jgi:hypothetical protein
MKMVPDMWKCPFRLEDSFDYCLFLEHKWQTQTDKSVGTYPPKSSSKRERERERERERVQRHTPVRVWSHLCNHQWDLNPEPFQDVNRVPDRDYTTEPITHAKWHYRFTCVLFFQMLKDFAAKQIWKVWNQDSAHAAFPDVVHEAIKEHRLLLAALQFLCIFITPWAELSQEGIMQKPSLPGQAIVLTTNYPHAPECSFKTQ